MAPSLKKGILMTKKPSMPQILAPEPKPAKDGREAAHRAATLRLFSTETCGTEKFFPAELPGRYFSVLNFSVYGSGDFTLIPNSDSYQQKGYPQMHTDWRR